MGPLLTEDEARNLPRLPNRYFIHEGIPWPDLVQSAKRCYCCEILLKGTIGCLEQHQLEVSHIEKVSFRFYYCSWIDQIHDHEKFITCDFGDGREFSIEFFTLEDDSCPCPEAWEDVPISIRTSAETNSEEAFAKACEWLEDCDDRYHGYGTPEKVLVASYCFRSPDALATELPTRVVDVGRHDGKVRLIEGNGQKHRYMCLSHCWGSHQIITTTKSTIMNRMQGIRTEDLSKTFMDAIMMTRRFGIDYIWIDSLCIIQNDSTDWERESARMASIYRNAYLTLAATKSSSGDGGLFAKTPDFEVSGTTPAGEDYCLIFREKMFHILSPDSGTSQFPLMTRAWIFQERILSTRVLHFGYHELFYECLSDAECECGSIGFVGYTTEDTPIPNPKLMYSNALHSVAKTRKGRWTNKMWMKHAKYFIARMWRSLVMDYTGLRISILSDRLPAIGGVARTFAAKRKTSYLAGLFEDSLLDDLLWHSFSCKKPRLSKWRAPSWSWASIETHVSYRDGIVYYDDEMFTERPAKRIEFASIEHCTCEPAGLDDFGQVRSASLRITGQLLPTTLLQPGLDRHQRPMYCVYAGDIAVAPRMWPDYDLSQAGPYQVLPGTEVYCLRIIRLIEDEADISLIVRAVTTQHGLSYERIGFLQLDPRTTTLDGLEPEMRDSFVSELEKAEVKTVNII